MRKRRLAASTAILMSVGSLTPAIAQAATSAATTLYVNNASGAHCSTSGPGTSAAPYCTVQSAVDAVVAGQTVLVEPGYYPETVTVTKAGTSTAPIAITAANSAASPNSADQQQISVGAYDSGSTAPAFTFSDASYVTVSGFESGTYTGAIALVEGASSHVTIDGTRDSGQYPAVGTDPAIHVAGTASYVTVSRNYLDTDGHTAGVQVDAGSSHDTITTNIMTGFGAGVVADGATDTAVTGNTIEYACDLGIALTGASTGSAVENNLVSFVEGPDPTGTGCADTTKPLAGIEVDSAAVSGTTLDYNIDYQVFNLVNPYIWAGTPYQAATDLNTATGQGAHDLNVDPETYSLTEAFGLVAASPAVDSADAGAPGEPTTDFYGNNRADDPNVANTGAGAGSYYDRGAVEYEDPLAVAVSFDSQVGTAPASFTATESVATAGWSAVTSWTIDFGDGSAATTTTTPSAVKHTYSAAGTFTVKVTGTDSYGSASTKSTMWLLASSAFHPLSATRLLDTRNGTGTGGVKAPVNAGGVLALKIEGNGVIPATGVTAVTLNVTATGPTRGGNITAYADGASRPNTSNLNFAAGQTVANQVIVPVGSDGKIDLADESSGTVNLVADVAGYYGVGSGTGLSPEGSPVRILDSRNGTGTAKSGAVPAHSTLKLTSDYVSGAGTVLLNVTVTAPTQAGFLIIYPDGSSPPNTSNVNFAAGQTVANQVVVQSGADGSIDFYNAGTGTVQVIADLLGSFDTGSGLGYVPIAPVRLLDTRIGLGAPKAKIAAAHTVQVTMTGVDGLPGNLQAMAANVTVTSPTSGGDIEAFPDYLSSPPGTSTVNFAAGQTVANETTLSGQSTGIKLFNQSPGSTDLIVDVFGYYQ